MRLFATLLRRGDVEGVRIDCARAAPPCRAPIYGNTARRSARWRYSAPATSAGVLHRGWRYRRRARRRLPGRVQGAQRPYDHRRAERSGDRARPETYGMPAGVFNMIFGNRVGADLVQHPAIQAVGFTGSLRESLFDLATRRLTPSGLRRNVEHQPGRDPAAGGWRGAGSTSRRNWSLPLRSVAVSSAPSPA